MPASSIPVKRTRLPIRDQLIQVRDIVGHGLHEVRLRGAISAVPLFPPVTGLRSG